MKSLLEIRKEIDAIDDQIIDLLAKRYAFAPDVVAYKKAHNISYIVPKRVTEVIERNAANAIAKNLNPDLVRTLYTAIIDEYHRIELELFSNH